MNNSAIIFCISSQELYNPKTKIEMRKDSIFFCSQVSHPNIWLSWCKLFQVISKIFAVLLPSKFLKKFLCLYLKRLPSHFEDETEEKYFNQAVELCSAAFTVKWTVCYCCWCCIEETLNLNYNLNIFYFRFIIWSRC